MRDRRKRLKPAPSSVEDSHLGCGIDSGFGFSKRRSPAAQQNGATSSSNLPAFDCGTIVSKCSVRLVHEVVSKFDQVKQDLVKSIGFDGILHFPPIKQFNRKFSLWLMSCVDERSATINIGNHISISFTKIDVRHVFGIPYCGKTVLEPIVASRDAKDRVIQQFLGQDFNELRSIKIAQEIVERNYGQSMTKEDADRFRVAFVVFVVSNLLCPSAKHDYAAMDYWNAIQDPDSISSYDWCEFVITMLLEAVTKLKLDITNNIKFPNISAAQCSFRYYTLIALIWKGYPWIIIHSHELGSSLLRIFGL